MQGDRQALALYDGASRGLGLRLSRHLLDPVTPAGGVGVDLDALRGGPLQAV